MSMSVLEARFRDQPGCSVSDPFCYGRPGCREAPQKQGAAHMKTYTIAAIAGDGIGPEVIAAGVEVLTALRRARRRLRARGRALRLGLGLLPAPRA